MITVVDLRRKLEQQHAEHKAALTVLGREVRELRSAVAALARIMETQCEAVRLLCEQTRMMSDQAGWTMCGTCGRCHQCHQLIKGECDANDD